MTGNFDNWSKSIKLDKDGSSFHKTVSLPGEEKHILYKFVVDGEWTTDSTARQERDHDGNLNNVVEARELSPEPETRPPQAFISSVHPQSTTAALAGQVPLEKERNVQSSQNASRKTSVASVKETSFPPETPGFEDLPGQFPVTPMTDLKQFINPGTASSLKSSTDGTNESRELPGSYAPSTIKEEKEDTKAFGVNPIPATGGIGNPIKLAAGEPVPHPSTITSNTVQSTVRDGSQYGVSDTGAPVLPPVLDSQGEAEARGASMFSLPALGGNMIPESSLPMGNTKDLPNFDNAFTSSAAPRSTTAQLAGQVPLESRAVPKTVDDATHVSPEATTSAMAQQAKQAMEGGVTGTSSAPTTGVPGVVSESQQAAHASPEAAANPNAVREKAAVENELKQTVSNDNSTATPDYIGNAASSVSQTVASIPETVQKSHVPEAIAGGLATAGAVGIGAALLAKDKLAAAYTQATEPAPASKEVPEIVTESQERAHVEPEASASPEIVREKAAFEDELKHAIPEAPATSESGALGASKGGLTGKIAAGTAAVGTAAAGLAYAARDQATNAYQSAGAPLTKSLSGATQERTVDGSVPEVVTESQQRAHASPEAAASPLAVREKTAVEGELLSEVSKAPATSESGLLGRSEQGITGKAAAGVASVSAAASTQANKAYENTGIPAYSKTEDVTGAEYVPEVVHESQERAHVSPEASANPEAVHEKRDVESELLSHVNKAPATSESGVFGTSEKGILGAAAAGVAAIGATAAGAAYAARDKAAELAGADANSSQTTGEKSLPIHQKSTVQDVVPEVVHESQEKAHVSSEASANPEAVHEKRDVESELLAHVNKAPATTESGAFGTSEKGVLGAAAAGVAALGATAAGAAYAARDKATELTGSSVAPSNNTSGLTGANTTSNDTVPEVVHESQERAHVSPEASVNPEAVHEKRDVESELLSHVRKTPATTESGVLGSSEQGITGKAAAGIAAGTAALGATAAGAAYAARDKAAELTGSTAAPSNSSSGLTGRNLGSSDPFSNNVVPEVVHESQQKAHVSPEASSNPEAVHEKQDFEKELLSNVNKAPATSESGVFGKSQRGLSDKATAGIAAGTTALGATAAGAALSARDKTSEVIGHDADNYISPSVLSAINNMNQGLPPTNNSIAAPKNFTPGTVVASEPDLEAAVLNAGNAASAAPVTSLPVAQSSRLQDDAPRDLTGGHSTLPTSTQPATTNAGAFTENTGLSGATTSATPIYNEATSPTVGSTGLNAPASSQAQIPAPKTESLAAPVTSIEHSRDVSPMTRPDSSKQTEPKVTTGLETTTVPAVTSAPTTPQRHATKRSSGLFRGTPQSDRTSVAGSARTDDEGKSTKKKGFLAKLKEKFRG